MSNSKNIKCGLKIRFEVMNIINKSHSKSVKIPSAQELANKFDMSRRSVTIELKNLIDEGWLYGVRGSGTYTNPQRSIINEHLPSKNIIGILTGDSRQYCYDYNHWAFLSSPGFAIMSSLGFPHPVRLSSLKPEAVYDELQSLNLNGIIWSWPPNNMELSLKKLMEAGVHVVTLVKSFPGIPAVVVDYEQCGKDIVKLLEKEKRSSILWCAYDSFVYERMSGAFEIQSRNGYKQDPNLVISDISELETKLSEMIEKDQLPDAIYLHGTAFYVLRDVFSRYGLDPFDGRCRLIAGWSVAKDIPGFKGIIRKYPYDKISEMAVKILKERFDGRTQKQSMTIKMEVKLNH